MTDTQSMGTAVEKLKKKLRPEETLSLSGGELEYVKGYSKVTATGEHLYVESYYRSPRGDVIDKIDAAITPSKVASIFKTFGLSKGGWNSSGKVKHWGSHMEGYEAEAEKGPEKQYGGNFDFKLNRRIKLRKVAGKPTGRMFITYNEGERQQPRQSTEEAFQIAEDAFALSGFVTYRGKTPGHYQKPMLIVEPKVDDNNINDTHVQRGLARFEPNLKRAIENVLSVPPDHENQQFVRYQTESMKKWAKALYKARGFKNMKAYLKSMGYDR